MMTNEEFAKRVHCHHTMASRLRNGERLPSLQFVAKIVEEFGLSGDDALAAVREGRFAAWLRATVFDAPAA